MSLWSSFGQTFFISLFSAEIRAELALTHGEFGSYYALATTASAVCLYWVGKLADTVGVPRLSVMTLGAVCLAAMHFLICIFSSEPDDWSVSAAPDRTGDDVSCLFHRCCQTVSAGTRAGAGLFRVWHEYW